MSPAAPRTLAALFDPTRRRRRISRARLGLWASFERAADDELFCDPAGDGCCDARP